MKITIFLLVHGWDLFSEKDIGFCFLFDFSKIKKKEGLKLMKVSFEYVSSIEKILL